MLDPLKNLRAALSQPPVDAVGHTSGQVTSEVSDSALDLLGLAIASLEKLAIQELEPRLCQVAVLGPTQAGKSTLVNLLVGSEVTTVSALAGHTRHARGAAIDVDESVLVQISTALEPARRVAAEDLVAEDLDQYSLLGVESLELPALAGASARPCIVWDTPDFDSLAADTYRRAVLNIAGMADVLVLIVSRDKYGDMTVWELLDSLAHLHRRGVLVVNKVEARNWPELRDHLQQTQVERLGADHFAITSMAHMPEGKAPDPTEVFAKLDGLQPIPAAMVASGISELLHQGWDDWLAPVIAEDAAQAAYRQALTQASDQFMQAYRRDYLADAERYDTFQRLLGELLVLLEIPALARTMGSVRRVVTWPVRQIFGKRDAAASLGREPELLEEGASHLLLGLRMTALEATPANPFWSAVAKRLNTQQPQLLAAFEAAAVEHHENFSESVAVAAKDLYRELQETPALLNSLRVLRAGADAAGVVVAVQTGGIGLADLVLTPVMLSLTTTLTESAAKTYVDKVVADLKEQQYAAVEAVLARVLTDPLRGYSEDETLLQFADLSADQLAAAREAFVRRANQLGAAS